MFVASITFRFGQETLQRPLEFIGKLVEHHVQSPLRHFLMFTVWPYIAETKICIGILFTDTSKRQEATASLLTSAHYCATCYLSQYRL